MQCFRCISDLFKVNATDKDSLQNGYGEVLYYILHSSNVPSINIDRISGEINLTQPIADDIEIYVEACDNPTQQSSRYASLYCYCYVLIKLWNKQTHKQTNKQTNKWEWYCCYSAFNVLCIINNLISNIFRWYQDLRFCYAWIIKEHLKWSRITITYVQVDGPTLSVL